MGLDEKAAVISRYAQHRGELLGIPGFHAGGQDQQVRLQLSGQTDRLPSIRRLTDQFQVRLAGEDRP